MIRTVRVGAVQANAELCHSEKEFRDKIYRLASIAKKENCEIIVFPEDIGLWLPFVKESKRVGLIRKFLSGDDESALQAQSIHTGLSGLLERISDWVFNHLHLNYLGELLSQSRISAIMDRVFSEVAKDFRLIIVGGSTYVRKKEGLLNISCVYDTNGSKAGETAKYHLIPIETSLGSVAAEGITHPILTSKYSIGVCICYDLNYYDVTKGLANHGAQLICSPSSGIRPYPNYPFDPAIDMPQIQRAKECGLSIVRPYMCGWMEPGLYFDGRTSVVDMNGNVIAKSKSVSKEEVVVVDVPI